MPSWAKAQVMGTKPVQFLYSTKLGIEGVTGKQLLFVPMFDVRNACDSTALGTGAGYKNFTLTTENLWPAMLGDSPQQMFSWLVNSGIDSETEWKRRYLWAPRKFTWEITNQETFPNQLKIYWVRPRRDLDYDTTDFVSSDLSYMRGQDLNEVMLRMFTRDGLTTFNVNQLKQFPVSFTPFHSHTWCQYFKVVKVTKLKLDAGQCAVIKRTNKRWLSLNDVDIGDIEYVASRSSLIPVFTVFGCPIFDSTDIRKVDTGKVRINIVYTARWPWYTLNTVTQQTTKVDLVAPGGAPTSARYVSKPVASSVAQA